MQNVQDKSAVYSTVVHSVMRVLAFHSHVGKKLAWSHYLTKRGGLGSKTNLPSPLFFIELPVPSRADVYKGYRFCIFLRFFYWIF